MKPPTPFLSGASSFLAVAGVGDRPTRPYIFEPSIPLAFTTDKKDMWSTQFLEFGPQQTLSAAGCPEIAPLP
jgi:hypothetical protein